MDLVVKHSKVSAISDSGANTLVQPSDWNAAHVLTGDPLSVGDILITSRSPGTGYLPCNGNVYAQSAYSALYSVLGKIPTPAFTIRTSAVDSNWFSVCWAPSLGLFCAVANVATGNRVMTSPDGVTWTPRVAATANNWISVCWSAELSLFVAVANSGTGNRVMTSPDGINWTSRASAADNSWVSVCWAPSLGLFCAVANSGTGNRVMTSTDGILWTIRANEADNTRNTVCWATTLGKL